MLDSMRTLTNNWLGRILLSIVMGFIILSFGVWGIADIFRGFGQGNLAQVGSSDISIATYRTAYQREIQQAQQQARRVITPDEARKAGLDRLALSKLITDQVLDQKAAALSLGMSDEAIAKSIGNDPEFQSISGKFDKAKFEAALRNSGYSEAEFVADQRRNYLRREIASAVVGDTKLPDIMLDMFNRYASEQREVDYVTLPITAAGDIAAPDASVLQSYFDARKAEFRAPEYRKIVTLAVTPVSIAKPDAVSDAEVAARYEKVKDTRFTTSETRDLQQIVFPNVEEATAALAKIKAGTSFAALASERNLKATDIDLGTKTKSELFDKAVADAGYALGPDGVSEPVKTAFGFALIHAAAINPQKIRTLEDVASGLRQEIAREQAKTEVQTIHDKIEDQRAAGKPLSEAVKVAGLDVKAVEAVDSNGLGKDGKPAIDNIEPAALLKAVFASDVGVDNDTILTRDGGYIWFEIQKIEPERERTLDEVKDKVSADWKNDEIAKKLSTVAADAVKKLNSGTSMNDVALGLGGLTIKTAKGIERTGKSELPANFVAQVFNEPVNGAGSVALASGERAVFKVTGSTVPPLDKNSANTKQIEARLKASLTDDMLSEYLAKLQADAGVRINEQAYNQIIGQN